MILDEIYNAIKLHRQSRAEPCPFPVGDIEDGRARCEWCRLLFPETKNHKGLTCPCIVLGDEFVESEMRWLFL